MLHCVRKTSATKGNLIHDIVANCDNDAIVDSCDHETNGANCNKVIISIKRAGGLHENLAKFVFLVVSDRVDQYLSDAFGPVEKYRS